MATLQSYLERGFTAVTALFTIDVMVGIALFRHDIFVDRNTITVPVAIILLGLAVILVFNLYSMVRLLFKPAKNTEVTVNRRLLVFLAVTSLVLLAVDKVMIDEIGGQYAAGMGSTGEWVMLYFSLSVQLTYVILYFFNRSIPKKEG